MGINMKKNILTIIIMAVVLINVALSGILIFTIVPATNRTNQLVNKVASIVDLELESPGEGEEIAVSDIIVHEIEDQLTISLASDDSDPHYAVLTVSLSMNSKHEDYNTLSLKIKENENDIKEIINDEFTNLTIQEIKSKKDEIRDQVLIQIREHFKSDFIISVSFGNILFQ